MAIELVDLVPRLKASLTAPGSPSLFVFTDGDTADWEMSLANAFWQARLNGFFTEYRVDPDTLEVAHLSGGDELPEEIRQVIVVYAAMIAIEARFMALADTRYKAGALEAETKRSATVLKELLSQKRAELDLIRTELDSTPGTSVGFIDLVVARHDQIAQGSGYWID